MENNVITINKHNISIMKKSLLIIVLTAMCATASAQDTVRYGDPWYQFKPMPNNNPDDPYAREKIEGAMLELRPFLGRPLLGPIQPYQNMGDTVYGIAVTHHPNFIPPYIFNAVLVLLQGVSIELFDTLNGLSEISVTEIDSIITLEAALEKQCVFEYEWGSGSDIRACKKCIEYYFETPIIMGRGDPSIQTSNDNYYIGGYVPANEDGYCFKELGCGIDGSEGQEWYLWGRGLGQSITCQQSSLTYGYNSAWGGLFPIVKLRCTVPRGLRIAGGADVTALWRSNTDADLFQLSVCTGDMPADSGILLTTADTSMALPALAADSTYRIYLRKQCAYCATTWADTVWSDWSAPVTIEASTGIRGMRQVSFTLSPNPAKGAVRLECGEPMLGVEVLDMAGRTVSSESVTRSSEFVIDISALPAGVYTVRVTTATGTAMRRLAVE